MAVADIASRFARASVQQNTCSVARGLFLLLCSLVEIEHARTHALSLWPSLEPACGQVVRCSRSWVRSLRHALRCCFRGLRIPSQP
eukprot:5918687-Pyramimonas_sp.AAC.1